MRGAGAGAVCFNGVFSVKIGILHAATAVVSRPITIVSIAHRILPRERFLASRLFPRPYRLLGFGLCALWDYGATCAGMLAGRFKRVAFCPLVKSNEAA